MHHHVDVIGILFAANARSVCDSDLSCVCLSMVIRTEQQSEKRITITLCCQCGCARHFWHSDQCPICASCKGDTDDVYKQAVRNLDSYFTPKRNVPY